MSHYIRKAVELADGFSISGTALITPFGATDLSIFLENPKQAVLDALAAQLVRQCRGKANVTRYGFSSNGMLCHTIVMSFPTPRDKVPSSTKEIHGITAHTSNPESFCSESSDDTMNTIKVIVDSGVLKNG